MVPSQSGWPYMAVLALPAIICGTSAAQGPKNLLFYGNSFTRGYGSTEAESFGGVPEVVRQLAVAAGYPAPRIENAAVNNQTLAWHLSNNAGVITDPQDFQEVPGFQWDAVVIQEYSTNPTSIGDPAGFRAAANALFGAVRSHSLAAKAILFQTWARGPGHYFYTDSPPLFPGGPAQMQQELRDNYELARQDLVAAYGPGSAIVARVGEAWQATGWDDLHAADIYHANTRGTYLSGLVIFGTVYGRRTTLGLPALFTSLTPQEAAALQSIADLHLPPGPSFDLGVDLDFDNDADRDDLMIFLACGTGPGALYEPSALPAPPPGCGLVPDENGYIAADFDRDRDVDQADFGMLQPYLTYPPPALSFAAWDIVFYLTEGSETGSSPNTVSTNDGLTPAVALSAVDLVTQAPPAWLTVPAAVPAATPFAVNVNGTGLPPGSYYARVAAAAGGYQGAAFNVILNVISSGLAQTLLFDFGSAGQQATGSYNNITDLQTAVTDAIDSAGRPTGVSLTVTDAFWPGFNPDGTTDPLDAAAMFDIQAARDSLFGNTVLFGGSSEPTAGFTLAGLSTRPGVTYTFSFFGSRMGASDNRETAFQVTGSSSGTAYLNPSDNRSAVAVVSGITPTPGGTVTVALGPGPNNNNPYGFYYLGAMKVVREAPSTVYFDFGSSGRQTAGNCNNVTEGQSPVTDAVDGNGNATGISLSVTDAFWPGANIDGTTTPDGDAAMLNPQTTRDSLFGNTVEFGGSTEPTGGFTLAGLSTQPGVTYTLVFFASRMGASDNRETAYQVVGANSGTAYLNPADNRNALAVVPGIIPAPGGTITVTVGPGPNNDNPYGFYYLGGMRLVRSDP